MYIRDYKCYLCSVMIIWRASDMDKIIESRRIREEQDAAYLESLRIDQEKVC